jgi:hypothetical protein
MLREKNLWLLIFLYLFLHVPCKRAEACPACWAGYGSGDERFNKPLADIRIIYEKQGKDALPYIRNVLKTSTDPLVIKRTAGYIVDLDDRDSIPLLEDMLVTLTKRVAFSSFGLNTYDFQCRMAVAHALIRFGPTPVTDRIWDRYDRLDFARKSEVPYILNALEDPSLIERLEEILEREEDHQLMMGALDVLGIGGNQADVPLLRSKIQSWDDRANSSINYSVLKIKAEWAISAIEDRST